MKKFITSILMLGVCAMITAQSVNVSGVITNPDGSAAESVFLSLLDLESDESMITQSDENGVYQFTIDLDNGITEGCFELLLVDCTYEAFVESDCYSSENTDFNYDFVYCEFDGFDCSVIVFSEVVDSSYLLTAWSFGVGPYTYVWNEGSVGSTINLPFGAEGVYCVTVIDSEGCVTEGCVDLSPPDPCFVNIYEEFIFNSIVLFAEAYGQTAELDYLWSTGETTESITITESGEYCVTMTDGFDCESYDCRYFEIDSTWIEDCFSYIFVTTEDSIDILNVESFGDAPVTYVWSFGDEVVSTSQSYIPTEVGTYCVEVVDANGCATSACYDYFIWEDCGVWLACDPAENGVSLWAFGYGAEPLEYAWNNGEVGQDIVVSESGEYCVTITDADGCSSSACLQVDVQGVAECFTPIQVTEYESYSELFIDPITDGEYEFIWSTGEITSSITVEISGTYCVDVFELETGCFFSTCLSVYIEGQEECWGYIEIESLNDSSAVLTVYPFDSNNNSNGFQYDWGTGSTAQSIEVFEDGTYCVTIYGLDGCEFETCIDVVLWENDWGNTIWGVVFDSGSEETVDAAVDIYKLEDDGSLELYSEGNETFDGGFFMVEGVDYGNYIALAVVEGDSYVPTYGYSTTSWESAQVYVVDDNTSIELLEISMIPINGLAGGGTIEGSVSTENIIANDKGSESRSSNPLEGANIMLMHSAVPVGQLFSDDQGNFIFAGLPFGTYNVVLEIPGFPRKVIEVTLSEDNPHITDIEFETSFTTTSTENVSALSSLTLSPNPTSNTLEVNTFFSESKSILYKVVDMNGRIIKSTSYIAILGENKIRVDVSEMDNGVYNLVIQTDETLIAKRFIKL